MQRVSGANYLANGAGAGKNTYQDYNPATGQAGTTPNAAALNALQEEIASLIEWLGLALNPADNTQLRQAIIAYVGTQISPLETSAAATAALTAAIAGLDNPAEVSAAIGTALTAYAPLNSPALTGAPTSPTPGGGDNSTKIATTAFVQSQLASALAPYETSAAATGALAAAIAGVDNPSEVSAAIASALTAYAPLASPGLTGTPTAPAAPANDNSATISTTSWIWTNIQALVASCIAAVATAAGFSYSFGPSGYFKLPSWLGAFIMQWAPVAIPSGANTVTTGVTFPIAFPNACRGVLANQTTRATSSWGPLVCGALSITATGFTMQADVANGSVSIATGVMSNYFAIGN